MGRDFYHEQLARSSPPAIGSASSGSSTGAAATARAVPGRGQAAVLHLLVVMGGPIGFAVHVLLFLLGRRNPTRLVRETNASIMRFAAQLLVLFAIGLALHLGDLTLAALVPWMLMLACFLVLPLVAALQTWRTGRVFRYPLWDLVRRPRSPQSGVVAGG